MPGPQAQQRRAGVQITVDMNQMVANMHGSYSDVIARLIQENAELSAGLAAKQSEVEELAAKVAALQAAGGVKPVTTLGPATLAAGGAASPRD